MNIKRTPIITVDETDAEKFEGRCAELLEEDYALIASDCGFVQSESYGFCSAYHAIFQCKMTLGGI